MLSVIVVFSLFLLHGTLAAPDFLLIASVSCLSAHEPVHRDLSKRACGQDAYFFHQDDDRTVVGVADGADSGLFAWSLAEGIEKVMGEDNDPELQKFIASLPMIDAEQILWKAWQKVLRDDRVTAGSSTVTLLDFRHYLVELRAANLGDSGFVVVRDGSVLATTFPSSCRRLRRVTASGFPGTSLTTPRGSARSGSRPET